MLGHAVMDLVYNGRLYAAPVIVGYSGVYMYNGGNSWTLVGDGLDRGVFIIGCL